MLHIQTEEAAAYKPTLTRPSARNSHYGIGERRCRGYDQWIVKSCGQTSSHWAARIYSYHCCCEPGVLSLNSRHDVLDSPSTLGTWVPSPIAWGRNRCARRGRTCWMMLGWLDGNFSLNEYGRGSTCFIGRGRILTSTTRVPGGYTRKDPTRSTGRV